MTTLPGLPDRLLSITEAADYLNVSVRWMEDAVQSRRVRHTRIGKHVRFTPAHVLELIKAGEQAVTDAVPPRSPATSVRPSGSRSKL